MNKYALIIFIICSCILVSFRLGKSDKIIQLVYPDYWPDPAYDFNSNPTTEQGFQLGRILFYDPNLSRDNTISCASCHLQFTGFTHVDQAVSHGIEGRKGTRNSPALINLAWNTSFHWDGGVNHIEVQPINPIEHIAEMDNTLENVLAYINASQYYKKLFYNCYGDSIATTKTLLKSIAQFTTSLVSYQSKYDNYIAGEVEFSEQELKGLKLFEKHCSSCHTEPLFNTNQFKSNGLPIDTTYSDVGRYNITKIGADSMKFRVPTLRNIEHTFPYMHDGRFKKLKDVLDHYTNGIDHNDKYLSNELRSKIDITDNDKKDIIAFLYTLTDKTFLYNPRYRFPR